MRLEHSNGTAQESRHRRGVGQTRTASRPQTARPHASPPPPPDGSVRIEFFVQAPPIPTAASQDRLYIAGDHPRLGQWRADGLPLAPLGGGEYHGQIDLPRAQTIEYKITRGTWETVE